MSARRILAFACAAIPMAAAATLTPTRLRCEHLVDPMGIDVHVPRLTWIVESHERGQRQSGYRILVSSSPALLGKGKGDLWDSGRVASDETALIEYRGRALKSGERAW